MRSTLCHSPTLLWYPTQLEKWNTSRINRFVPFNYLKHKKNNYTLASGLPKICCRRYELCLWLFVHCRQYFFVCFAVSAWFCATLFFFWDEPQNVEDVASVRVDLHHDTADVWGSWGVARRPSGSLSGLLSTQDRSLGHQRMVGVSRVSDYRRLCHLQ